jgi:arsenate reductase
MTRLNRGANTMSEAFPIIIHHNPDCGTSRNVLAAVQTAGFKPRVVEYLKTGWDRAELERLVEAMGLPARELLRPRETRATVPELLEPGASDDAVLDAMVAHPGLANRPIVETPPGVRLCRPADRVRELLPSV